MKTKTQFTQEQINEVMQKRGTTRESAIRWLNRNSGDKKKGTPAKVKDNRDSVQVPGLGDIPLVEAPKKKETSRPATDTKPEKTTAAQVSANRKEGLRLFALAGRPSHPPKGTTMTWVQRVAHLGVASTDGAALRCAKAIAK